MSHQTFFVRVLTCANSFMSFLYFSQTFHKPAKKPINYGNNTMLTFTSKHPNLHRIECYSQKKMKLQGSI